MKCLHECHHWHTYIGLSKHYLIKPLQTAAKVKTNTQSTCLFRGQRIALTWVMISTYLQSKVRHRRRLVL